MNCKIITSCCKDENVWEVKENKKTNKISWHCEKYRGNESDNSVHHYWNAGRALKNIAERLEELRI